MTNYTTEPVFENDNYKLLIGESSHDDSKVMCYQIVNKKTELVEAETTVLPRAIGIANECDKDLKELSPIVQAPLVPHLNS